MNPLKPKLEQWLAGRVTGATQLRINAIHNAGAAGFSAETSFLDVQWQSGDTTISQPMVLRRQIQGHDLLHQPELDFQAEIMDRLSKSKLAAPTPELVGLENNPTVLGSPFLVMKQLAGEIVPQSPNYNTGGWLTGLPTAQRADVWLNGIRAMASVHRVDWRDGFAFMARDKKPGVAGYVDWLNDWVDWAVAGRDYPVGKATLDYLKRSMPADASSGIVWGDSQPSNILFDKKTGEVTGLLDWELATIGPGEIDLAWWLMFDELFSTWMHVPRLDGLPGRAGLIACYEEAVDRPVDSMDYYDVLARLRMAIITMRAVDRQVAQGNYKADNNAWSHNPFTTELSQRLDLSTIETGADYVEFSTGLMSREE